jgi:signal transduction histidine kinase
VIERDAEFLDRLVHDLREPLRSIGVYSELLTEISNGRLGAEGDRVVSEILSGAARMGTMLEGLAGYSLALRASQGGSASLQSAFRIVTANLDDEIRGCNASVTGVGLPTVSVSLDRLVQLLENLIGNSLRFRSEAAPAIRITAAPEAGGEMWEVCVEDNGIGISPDDCETIFKPFMRVAGKKYPGAGLGLAICRNIVEAHGGTIRMESAPGGACICRFTLPA